MKISYLLIFFLLPVYLSGQKQNYKFTGSVFNIQDYLVEFHVTVAWEFHEVEFSEQIILLPSDIFGDGIELNKAYFVHAEMDNNKYDLIEIINVFDTKFLEKVNSLGQPIFVGNQLDDFDLIGYYFDFDYLKYVEWFGIYYTKGHPWWYHYDFGWIYDYYVSSSSLWFWSPGLGWVYTDAGLMPFLFTLDRGWLYFQKIKLGESWLYSFTEEEWQYYSLE